MFVRSLRDNRAHHVKLKQKGDDVCVQIKIGKVLARQVQFRIYGMCDKKELVPIGQNVSVKCEIINVGKKQNRCQPGTVVATGVPLPCLFSPRGLHVVRCKIRKFQTLPSRVGCELLDAKSNFGKS